MPGQPQPYFGLFDPARGTAAEGRRGQVMFRLDDENHWEPITPVLDMPTACDIYDRANRLAGSVLKLADMKVEAMEQCLQVRERCPDDLRL